MIDKVDMIDNWRDLQMQGLFTASGGSGACSVILLAGKPSTLSSALSGMPLITAYAQVFFPPGTRCFRHPMTGVLS